MLLGNFEEGKENNNNNNVYRVFLYVRYGCEFYVDINFIFNIGKGGLENNLFRFLYL